MIDKTLQNFDIFKFQANLINWYHANKRDLPWRKDQDPYKVWVSEIMLQQTKVDTVIPYFQRFITKYPTLQDLADADQQDVLKTWEGLGYYSRARNLQNAVREVVSAYGSKVPANPKELGALKGVGPYTQGAILSIAFNQPEPAVDGNVMRVLSRVLKIEEDIAQPKVKKHFERYTKKMISDEDPSAFNQGIMELGALVCTPKSPMCMLCPVQEQCRAFEEGVEQELPIKSKAKKQKTIPYVALLIRNEKNQYVIEKRSETGLLANMWQFPMVPIDEIGMDHIENWVEMEYGVQVDLGNKLGKLKHVFSHLIWQLDIIEATTGSVQVTDKRVELVDKNRLADYPFPVSHQKMMKYMREE
ncbi:A/G-specific DNA-adenine glycosylase [Virgibacillus subterraneus]|uniref:Adenine DNA glycosylase n=2 Tax=Virgibacillus TaxID=84406 RepID=A0A1H1G7V6_9BACI|nr:MULTISPECIES: A/G-specific adenine glycosylase [Virgibacillus]SDR09145.1 A/G-specific DNA-adenine glycosylase [Virgibacillus salinus]SER05278.1 A/G-specific DNA-adenine glycosylase [Virgibacillus subterraneus]